jgi:hypothetical protein
MSMNRSHIKSITASAVAAALLVGIAPLATATETMPGISVTPNQEFQSMRHELKLESGEKLLLAHRHKLVTYRLCVDAFKGSVPLRVFVDGQQSEVAVASCETVTGKHIRVEPAAELPGGDYLVARVRQIGE